jgi:ABC-type multidrug transport system ATPase subunit
MCQNSDVLLVPWLTAREHLDLATALSLTSDHKIALTTDQLLADVGLQDTQHTLARDLSVGQRRLLCVALAFVGDPGVVYLDEVSHPGGALESETRLALGRDIIAVWCVSTCSLPAVWTHCTVDWCWTS